MGFWQYIKLYHEVKKACKIEYKRDIKRRMQTLIDVYRMEG